MSSHSTLQDLVTPYAVYGTLRPKCGNDWLWKDMAVCIGSTTVDGYRLVTNGSFPYAIPAEGQQIVVDLIAPSVEHAAVLRTRLDRLEGYPDHYDRVLVQVTFDDAQINVWLYTPNDPYYIEDAVPVPGNDWLANQDEWEWA